ncbi:MAG: type II secretion system protein GspD, partial [Candidatus Dadabacteria bacterium]
MLRRALFVAPLLLALTGPLARAEAPKALTMNFKDAEIEAVVQFISELTGKNFILDEKVRGKITVIAPGKVTPEEAFQVFQAILNVKGFTIAPVTDNVFKLVATREAKQTNIETVDDGAEPGDRFVTRLLPLKFVEAETVAGILSPLVSKDSSIVA